MTTNNQSPLKPEVQPGVSLPDSQTQNLPNRRPMKSKVSPQKSAGAFRTISEVADDLKVEQHVLRFWETKFSQIKPLKRGGGRRYYRPEDVELLKNIHHLLYQEGYTIKGVQKLLSANRGNLNARVQGDEAAPAAEAPITKAVRKNKDELQSMLDELKSMRKLIG
ncbi:MAG: MerR family transcriptional regulator [Micavibrio sp.]|nr:MerR family transcriptional regulator [Micavibrio sp.]